VDQILAELLSRQNRSLAQRRGELEQQVEGLGATVETEHDTIAELQQTIDMSVQLARLRLRHLSLDWDRGRLTFASESWQSDIEAIVRAFNALASINQIVAENPSHWTRRSRPDAVAPALVEIAEPLDGRLVLGMPPPWSDPSGEGVELLPLRADIAGDAPTLSTPTYWPLIDSYGRFATGPVLLTDSRQIAPLVSAIAADPGSGGDSNVARLTRYLDPSALPEFIVPWFELATNVEPDLSGIPAADGEPSGTAAGPMLRLTLRGGFGVAPLRDLGTDISDALRENLEGALADLMQDRLGSTPTCTLTLTPAANDPTGVVMQWSDVGSLAGGLSAVMDEVTQLDPLVRALPGRLALEQELDSGLGSADSVALTPRRAYELLKEIWRTKGARARNLPGDLGSFSVNRQTAFRSRPKQRVSPTIFIEYVSGARWIYAIVWSAKRKLITETEDETIQEGPYLVRVGENASFHQPDVSLGSTLFDAVLDQVPRAMASGGSTPFVKHLGIVVAHDAPLSLADLVNLTFTDRVSRLEPAVLFGELEDADVQWNSLAALRSSDWACDYVLVRTLSDARPSFTPARGPGRWAIVAVDQAMQRASAGGP
jgi:hypothetical protein